VGPAQIIAGASGCRDLSRTRALPTLAAATFRISLIMERGLMRQRISPGSDYAGPRRGHGAGGRVDLKLGHHAKDGIEVIDVQGEIDMYTAPRLRELLIDLVSKGSYQLVVNLDKVGFLDSTGLGVLVGGLKRVRAHDGSLDLVCTQQRILKTFRITGLTEVFGIYETVDQAIAATKGRR
jgi:anti-sigma B factor antagonist